MVNRVALIPKDKHYAIITEKSVQVAGDQRSENNPGHGIPTHYIMCIFYDVFLKEDEWKAKIAQLVNEKVVFRAVSVTSAKVTSTVEVSIND